MLLKQRNQVKQFYGYKLPEHQSNLLKIHKVSSTEVVGDGGDGTILDICDNGTKIFS